MRLAFVRKCRNPRRSVGDSFFRILLFFSAIVLCSLGLAERNGNKREMVAAHGHITSTASRGKAARGGYLNYCS